MSDDGDPDGFTFHQPRPSERQPFLTLVENDFIDSMGNIPSQAWELVSYLDNEAAKACLRVSKMELKPEHEELRRIVLEKWERVTGYIDGMLVKSGSVKALRSWQMVQSFGEHGEIPIKPASTVVPDVPGTEERRSKFGIRR